MDKSGNLLLITSKPEPQANAPSDGKGSNKRW